MSSSWWSGRSVGRGRAGVGAPGDSWCRRLALSWCGWCGAGRAARRRRGSAGDDGAALCCGQRGAVGVADLVVGSCRQHAMILFSRSVRCGRARSCGVCPGDHEPVVAGGQGGVDAAGLVGGHEQGLAQRCVAGLGRRAVVAAGAGGGQGGDQAAERAGSGQGPEPGRVAEAGQDLRPLMAPTPGTEVMMPAGSSVVQQRGDLLLEVADLGAERQRQAGFGGDVRGQLGVVDFAVPELSVSAAAASSRAASSSPQWPWEYRQMNRVSRARPSRRARAGRRSRRPGTAAECCWPDHR